SLYYCPNCIDADSWLVEPVAIASRLELTQLRRLAEPVAIASRFELTQLRRLAEPVALAARLGLTQFKARQTSTAHWEIFTKQRHSSLCNESLARTPTTCLPIPWTGYVIVTTEQKRKLALCANCIQSGYF